MNKEMLHLLSGDELEAVMNALELYATTFIGH